MVTCWFYLSRVECWLFAHFTQTLFESRLWNGWNCISYTTNTKASPSNETLQGNFIALDCTLLWERDESNTTAMYHHRFGYTLWERNKHNIEEMKNKHKYKTLIKIRNIVNNRFYPLTVAWRKNSWAEQVRASQCCMMYVDLNVTLTGALTFSRQRRVDQQWWYRAWSFYLSDSVESSGKFRSHTKMRWIANSPPISNISSLSDIVASTIMTSSTMLAWLYFHLCHTHCQISKRTLSIWIESSITIG